MLFRQKSSTFVALFCGYVAMPKVENFCGGVRVSIERIVFVKLSVGDQTGGQTGGQTGSQTSNQRGCQTSDVTSQIV